MLRKYLVLCLLVAMLALSACSTRKIHIGAECGVVMNSVFNKISTAEDCRVQCRNQCSASDMGLASSALVHDSSSGCNSCDCICKG